MQLSPPTGRRGSESGTQREARRQVWLRRAVYLVPLAGYLLLVLLGVTNSNIGVSLLREDPENPTGTQLGASQAIRSDEYNTESTLWLGQMAMGSETGGDVNPLTVSPAFFAQLPDGPVSSVVFFEGTLLQAASWLPDAMLFAAKWWLPSLLLAIGLPVWFRQLTGSLRWGSLAAVLIFFSPSSMWWSGRPVNTLGFMFAACALGIYGTERLRERRWVPAVLALLGAGVLFARFPSYYQPLAIIIGTPVIVATGVYLLARPGSWRSRLVPLAAFAGSCAVWLGALMLEALPALRAGLETVYPGERRSTSESLSFGRVFGATNYGWLESVGSTAVNTNQTEIASSFTVLLVVLAILLAVRGWRGPRDVGAAIWTLFGFALFWLSWCTIAWGPLGEHLPLFNRVPGFRGSHAVGFVAILAFCLFMSQWRYPGAWRVPVIAGGATAFVSAYAGSSLQITHLPDLTTKMVWFAAFVSGAVVVALVRWPGRWYSMVPAGAAVVAMTILVNPILVGLGDLRDSDAAQMFLREGERARDEGVLWASDSSYVDALMMATGTPSLSSRQQIGPDLDEWERLDPGLEHEESWNRGGTYITFAWTDEPGMTFTNPSPDIVVMTTSPCTVADRIPELGYVVSGQPLTGSCLDEVDRFTWQGGERIVYATR
jgi:hypothetical protein